jgi:hypothetical protein
MNYMRGTSVDWEKVNADWGDIMKAAREHPEMSAPVDYDAEGRVYTTNRPMIESMVCAKIEKHAKIIYYLQLLGLHASKGRVIQLGVGNKMPMGTGGKGKKVKRAS